MVLRNGSISDGGTVAEIFARISGVEGTEWTAVTRQGNRWQLIPENILPGTYQITLQACDQAGNAANYGTIYHDNSAWLLRHLLAAYTI